MKSAYLRYSVPLLCIFQISSALPAETNALDENELLLQLTRNRVKRDLNILMQLLGSSSGASAAKKGGGDGGDAGVST